MPRRRLISALVVAVTATAGGVTAVVTAPAASAATVDTSASYVLVNRNSGKALDVYNLATTDGARITQWTRNDGTQQQWQFVDSGGRCTDRPPPSGTSSATQPPDGSPPAEPASDGTSRTDRSPTGPSP